MKPEAGKGAVVVSGTGRVEVLSLQVTFLVAMVR